MQFVYSLLEEIFQLPMTGHLGFRASAAFVTAFVVAILAGAVFIRMFASFVRSGVRQYTPDQHAEKAATPTMGGIFIIAAVLSGVALWADISDARIIVALSAFMGFAAIGLWDDWAKISRKKGISERAKFSAQILVAIGCVLLWYILEEPSTALVIPFFKGYVIELYALFFAWAIWVILSTTNAVNLTDGLDGLAASTLIPNFITFALIACIFGDVLLFDDQIINNGDNTELIILTMALAGALMGFLWFNAHPAQVFMGDVGALALGAVLAVIALMTKFEFLLPIAGGIFVLETGSVIVQVACNKLFGWRPFRTAPYHHHLELIGIPETKITARFTIITIILCLFALLCCL